MRPYIRTLTKVTLEKVPTSPSSVPVFLCPAVLRSDAIHFSLPERLPSRPKPFSTCTRSNAAAATATIASPSVLHQDHAATPVSRSERTLPTSCPGCGAFTQTIHPHEAGFYSPTRSAVKSYMRYETGESAPEDRVFNSAIQNADPEILKQLGLDQLAPGMSPTISLGYTLLTN